MQLLGKEKISDSDRSSTQYGIPPPMNDCAWLLNDQPVKGRWGGRGKLADWDAGHKVLSARR